MCIIITNYFWCDVLRWPEWRRCVTHCNTLQRTATHCHTLQHTATHCNTHVTCTEEWRQGFHAHKIDIHLCVALCCRVLQSVAECCSVLQCVAVGCSVLQCVAVCCSVSHCVTTWVSRTKNRHPPVNPTRPLYQKEISFVTTQGLIIRNRALCQSEIGLFRRNIAQIKLASTYKSNKSILSGPICHNRGSFN